MYGRRASKKHIETVSKLKKKFQTKSEVSKNQTSNEKQRNSNISEKCTPGSMNSSFGDFFREFWRGILGGVRDYLGEVLGGFDWKNKGIQQEKQAKLYRTKIEKIK